jgi:ubiquinone/menaquinone biosynthesis C-methylase UbiE
MTHWESYWKKKSIKKAIIELVRKHYFASMFASVVERYVTDGPVLEAGCGSCEILQKLSKRYSVTGLDSSRTAVKSARKNFEFPVVLGDIYNLPYEDNSFELIYNQGVMEHFSDKEMIAILKEFSRVAKKVLIFVPSNLSVFRIYNPFDVDDARFLSPKKMTEIFKSVFPIVEAEYIYKSCLISTMAYGEKK